MHLSRFARRRYTAHPTPLEFLPNFTRALGGPQVWIKRDDMTGLAPGGNKTRKLEFLLADALAQGADTLVTCGAPQSNHCRSTLAAANKEGLRCRLVVEERLADSFREDANGNHFLYRLLGVEAITVVPGGTNMVAAMQQVADELRAQERRPYVIPGGGSNALGGLGYVVCAQELKDQLRERNQSIDRIFLASGSSGTHGGMLAGCHAVGLQVPIVGIGISRDPEAQDPLVRREAEAVLDLLGVHAPLAKDAVRTFGEYWRPKYSVPTPNMIEAVQLLARTEAILLDPVYTGKAMAGMIDLYRRGIFPAHETALFLHTGGVPALFAYRESLA